MGTHQTFAIVHANDIDGIGSAALIRIATGIPTGNIFFYNYSEESLDYITTSIISLAKPGCSIILADMSPNDSKLGKFVSFIRDAKRIGCSLVWLDHHQWSDAAISAIAAKCDMAIVGENKQNCAADIVAREFHLSDQISSTIREIAHVSDFKLKAYGKTKLAVEYYSLAITYYNMLPRAREYAKLRAAVDSICNGKIPAKEVISDARAFKKLNTSRIRRMLSHLLTFGDVAVGFSEPVVANDACDAILRKSGKKVAIYVNTKTGKVHLRSQSVDTVPIAAAAGGGGHPFASGFNINIDNYGHFRKDSQKSAFVKRLKGYFARLP